MQITYSQYHGCWWSGDTRSQSISNHGIDLVCPKYLASAWKRLKTKGACIVLPVTWNNGSDLCQNCAWIAPMLPGSIDAILAQFWHFYFFCFSFKNVILFSNVVPYKNVIFLYETCPTKLIFIQHCSVDIDDLALQHQAISSYSVYGLNLLK